MRYSLVLALFAVACVDPSTSTTTSDLTVGTVGTVGTTATAPPKVTFHLWHADDNVGYIPPGSESIQVLVTPGDAGGPLTGDQPTFYAWILGDGSNVFYVYRVPQPGTDFYQQLDDAFAAQEALEPELYTSVTGVFGPAGPRKPPAPIGPGGDGAAYIADSLVEQALTSASQIQGSTQAFVTIAEKQ